MVMTTGKAIEILQVMGITAGEGMGEEGRRRSGGDEGWGGGVMCVTRNVQQWIMKVHQCQLSFILITNSPCL